MKTLHLNDKIEFYDITTQEIETEAGNTFKIADIDYIFDKMNGYGIVEEQFNDEVHRTDLDYAIENIHDAWVDYLNELVQRFPKIRAEFKIK